MKTTYNILGMHCSSCVSKVEKTLEKIDGIHSANVNLLSENVLIKHQKEIPYLKIKNAIKAIGFELLVDKKIKDPNNKSEYYRTMKKKLILSFIFGIPLILFSMIDMFYSSTLTKESIIIQFCLASIILYIGRTYYYLGLKAFFNLNPDMNSLITLGTGSAYIYSIISLTNIFFNLNIYGFDKLYFESSGIIIVFIILGRFLESRSKENTNFALLNLLKGAPRKGFIEKNKIWTEVPIDEITIGSWVLVKPGGQIPVDGIVLEGNSFVDESSITGEPVPIEKKSGDKVMGATINKNGQLIIQAESLGSETIYSRIIKLVEETQLSKAPIQNLVDKIAYIFVPIVCSLAILSSAFWYFSGQNFEFCINIFISVLIIACPCSLGLATPTAIVVGSGIAANKGIHFKSSKKLQLMDNINVIVFDKTGTLTSGKMVVTDTYTHRREIDFLEIICSLENASEHPLGKSIIDYAKSKKITISSCNDFKAIPGEGINGTIEGKNIFVGKYKYLEKMKIIIPDEIIKKDIKLRKQGKTVIHCGSNQSWIGLVALEDKIKPEAEYLVYKLQKQGIDIWMVTGDDKVTSEYVANSLGIKNVLSGVLPNDKSELIKKLQNNGTIVAMVGDGINDSPAIAQSDIGISIGSGTDVAIEASDVVLINQKIDSILTAIDLSKSIFNKIKQNLFWAFAYNIIGIPIAMGMLYIINGYLLNPMLAGFIMAFSSLSVVGNTLLLKKKF